MRLFRRPKFSPNASRADSVSPRATHLLGRLFGDAPRPAIAMLVEAVESLDPELLDELGRAVTARRRSRRGS